LDKSYKLDSQPIDEDLRPKSGKSWHHFGEKIYWFKPKKKELKRRVHDLKNQDAKLGSNAGSNSMTQLASNESKVVPGNFNSRTSCKVGITHLSRKNMCCIDLGPTNP
jgi:hypothetical protein